MRKFFRSIHWSDKVIDILVVVLGITIAFGLNNWRENRQNAKLEQQYLKNLKEDLVKDSLSIEEGLWYMNEISFSIERILQLASNQENADSISFYFQSFGNDFLSFMPEDYTYDALRQTGYITLVESDSIRKNLSQLYDMYELLQMQVDIAMRYHFDLMLPYYYNVDYQKRESIDDTIYLTSRFQTTIIFYQSSVNNRYELMQASVRRIEKIIQLIDEELDE